MPRPTLTLSDTLTSITTPSFVDDGLSLTRRMPPSSSPDPIHNWLSNTVTPPVLPPTSATSDTAYTGSFVDDGADMEYPKESIPGFGIVNRKFYSKGKPRKSRDDDEWTVEQERALAGDMWRSLGRLRSFARVDVRDADDDKKRARMERKERRVGGVEEDGRVRIMKPLMWGTFVIEGEDGRVVVVDRDGEYDSGKVGEMEEVVRRERYHDDRAKKRKARESEKVDRNERARQGMNKETRGSIEREEKNKTKERAASRHQQRKDEHRRHRRSWSTTKPLTPILEADTPEESVTRPVSPTKFFMTGAQSDRSSSIPSNQKPAAAPTSPTKSPPGAWPSPELSPIKSTPSVELKIPTALSSMTSAGRSKNSWNEQKSWGQEASAVRLPSSTSSAGYSGATSSTISSAALQGSQTSAATWLIGEYERSRRNSSKRATSVSRPRSGTFDAWGLDVDEHSTHGSLKRAPSANRPRARSSVTWNDDADRLSAHGSSRQRNSFKVSRAGSDDSWKQDVDAFDSRVSQMASRSPNRSPIASISAWFQDDGGNPTHSVHSPGKSATSRLSASDWGQSQHNGLTPSTRSHKPSGSHTSVCIPYSWRRQVEEMSDHSTVGSNESLPRASSPAPFDDGVSDGRPIADLEGDTHSVKSYSTYKAPTVEDARDSEDGAQEWDSAWSVKDSQNDGDEVGNKGDRSGYEEDNDTWLDSETGGVKHREAEWRREPPAAGSWRDV